MDYFIALDVETANRDPGSICQLGLACFDGDDIAWQWSTLVNPEVEFDRGNIGIHGITPRAVAAAPTWPTVLGCIADSLRGQIIVSHTNFDELALQRASSRHDVPLPLSHWIDSHALARSAWPYLASHGLGELCALFDIPLNHHDALSDALACGRIVRMCQQAAQMSDEERRRQAEALSANQPPRYRRFKQAVFQEDVVVEPVLNGPLNGHVAVLTGEFDGGKGPLARLAASSGCKVEANFTKSRTTLLVLGRRDQKIWGDQKSGKHRQAEDAIAEGRNVRIVTEEEFRRLIEISVSSERLKVAI